MSVKRPAATEAETSSLKFPRLGYYYVLESESDLPTDEDSESIHSVQGKETDFAKDTTDTTSHSDWSDDINMNVEYEVASLSERENPLGDGSLSSDIEDIPLICAAGMVALCEGDLSTLADNSENSDSNQKFDPEVPRSDYWTCIQCNNKNNNPVFRYCEKCYKRRLCIQCNHFKKLPCFPCCDHCFKVRKNFFPSRPNKRRRRRNSNKKSSLEKTVSTLSTASTASTSSVIHQTDLDIAGSSKMRCDSALGSSQESFSSKLSDSTDSQLCITCMINPKNGIFVHKKVGHICCCYKCALKIWGQTHKCPICNCKISTVLKAIVH
ncbi:hypothetical protein C0J52_07824 [Blattella germanica]|nr:hypothetical protein C0J52_07824 [Blattella germanica]